MVGGCIKNIASVLRAVSLSASENGKHCLCVERLMYVVISQVFIPSIWFVVVPSRLRLIDWRSLVAHRSDPCTFPHSPPTQPSQHNIGGYSPPPVARERRVPIAPLLSCCVSSSGSGVRNCRVCLGHGVSESVFLVRSTYGWFGALMACWLLGNVAKF